MQDAQLPVGIRDEASEEEPRSVVAHTATGLVVRVKRPTAFCWMYRRLRPAAFFHPCECCCLFSGRTDFALDRRSTPSSRQTTVRTARRRRPWEHLVVEWRGTPPPPLVGCEYVARRPNRPGPHVHMYVRRVAWRLLFRTFSAFRLKSSTLSVPSGSVRFHTYVGPYASTFRAIRTMY